MTNHSAKTNDADLDFHKSSPSTEATPERGLCIDFSAAVSGTRGLEMSQSDSESKKKRKKQKGSCIAPENCGRDCDPPEGNSLLDLSSTEINGSSQSPVESLLNLEQQIAQSCLEVNCCQLNIERKEQKERQSGLGINGAGCDLQVYSRRCGKSSGQFQSGLEEVTGDASSHCLGEVPSARLQENLPEALSAEDATSAQVMGNVLEEVSFCSTDGEPTSRDSKEEIEITNLENNSHELSFVNDVSVRDTPIELFEQKNGAKNHNNQMTGVDMLHGNEYLSETALCTGEEASKSRFDSSLKHPEQMDVETENKMEVGPSSNSRVVKDDADLDIIITHQNVSQVSDFPPERALKNPYKKKLLILDVNGLLADVVSFVPYGYKVDMMISGKAVFKRPFCDDFLEFCFDRFDVGVWSSRTKRNMDKLIDFLMGDFRFKLLFCWDQSHCTSTGFTTIENKDKPLVLKELKKLWEKLEPNLPWEKGQYNEASTLLLDDSPYKALLNPAHTAIFPRTYRYRDLDDTSLGPGGDLQVYLEGLAVAEDVQKYVKQNPFGQRAITEANPSWGFYRKVIHAYAHQL